MARYPHWYKPDKDWKSNTWAIVDRAKRYRDASPAVKLDMDIEAKEQRYNMYRSMGYGHESLAEISQQIADLKAKKKELAPAP